MPPLDTAVIFLAGMALFAAFVNGALGYGFSSLTVPVALVFYANRVLNPAVVVIEVFINLYVLLMNLNGVRAVWKRVVPILIGLLPGIAVGASVLASLQPGWIKFGTYTVILPHPNGVHNVKSEVLYEIWRLFRQEGIQIPYPKRDLYVRSDLRT